VLSLIAFLLLPLVALGVRLRRGVPVLIVVMVIAGVLVDSDAQWHWLTALGSAGYDSTTIWAETVATTLAYIWFPGTLGLRVVQFIATVMFCLLLAWTLGGGWVS
jgi:hypothetical protein